MIYSDSYHHLVFSVPSLVFHEASTHFYYVFTELERSDWGNIFTDAQARGVYPGTYGMQNDGQFWDEMSRSWFGNGQDEYGGPAGIQTNVPNAYNRLMVTYGLPTQIAM